MSIADANSRTNLEHDFYQTLPCQIRCLCSYLNLERQIVMDAGAGKQVITRHIEQAFPDTTVLTSELHTRTPGTAIPTFNFEADTITYDLSNDFPRSDFSDFLDLRIKTDMVVSNPPYTKKHEFIEAALDMAPQVIMLFPLQVINYIDFCEKWLDNDHYCGRITMYPKVILNQEGTYRQGGNTGYGWFHWSQTKSKDRNKYEVFEDIRKYR